MSRIYVIVGSSLELLVGGVTWSMDTVWKSAVDSTIVVLIRVAFVADKPKR